MISQAPCATFGDPERGAERAGHNTETNGKNNAKRSTGTVKQKKGNQIKQNEISNKKVGAKIAKKKRPTSHWHTEQREVAMASNFSVSSTRFNLVLPIDLLG